jgi:hypothetical protein
MSVKNLTLPDEPPNFEDSIKCFLDLANKYGFFHPIHGTMSPEYTIRTVNAIMGNLKSGLDVMTTNDRLTYLNKIKDIRHQLSDEVWNAPIPGNGFVPYDYHQIRRSKFFDIIYSIPVPNGGIPNVNDALDEMFSGEFQGFQQMIDDGTRKKVLEYIDCLISIIIKLYPDVRNNTGGYKKHKKTHKKRKTRKFIKSRKSIKTKYRKRSKK